MANEEIERRLLVTKTRGANCVSIRTLRSLARKITVIRQGYFDVRDPDTSFRVRIAEDSVGNVGEAFLTVKTGKGLIRKEFETALPDEKFARLLFEKSPHRVNKKRYYIDGWEVDVFEDSLHGIVFAEKEMRSADEQLVVPDFIEEYREVTDYLTNLHLARLATDFDGLGVSAMPFVSENLLRTIPCIGLVGGPGSGKTGIIEILRKELPEIHFVPEVATIVINQLGISPSHDAVRNRRFQRTIYETIKIFRATSTEFAATHGKKGILFDRPEADGAGYFEGGISEFETTNRTKIRTELNKIRVAICLEVPSREIYEAHRKSNPARSETYEEALAREEKTRAIWQLHENFHFVSNEGGWDTKVEKVRQLVKEAIRG